MLQITRKFTRIFNSSLRSALIPFANERFCLGYQGCSLPLTDQVQYNIYNYYLAGVFCLKNRNTTYITTCTTNLVPGTTRSQKVVLLVVGVLYLLYCMYVSTFSYTGVQVVPGKVLVLLVLLVTVLYSPQPLCRE